MEGFTWCEGLEHWNPLQMNWWTRSDMHHSDDLPPVRPVLSVREETPPDVKADIEGPS